jgi:hypothetical protein
MCIEARYELAEDWRKRYTAAGREEKNIGLPPPRLPRVPAGTPAHNAAA